jgi:5-methylthioribose kinase
MKYDIFLFLSQYDYVLLIINYPTVSNLKVKKISYGILNLIFHSVGKIQDSVIVK